MSEYTKGPLQYVRARTPDNTGGYNYCIGDTEGKIIAETFEHVAFNDLGGYEIRPAAENARLYACAPEMAEMLLRVWNHGPGYARHEAEALLKKAGVLP
jgi:hypothetical protein